MSDYKVKDDRTRWRAALERMGLDQVRANLKERPDRPLDDPFHDLVATPPFPTRGFVQQWLIDRENQIFRLSKSVVLICATAVLFLLFLYLLRMTWFTTVPQPPYNPAPVLQPNSPTVQ